MVENKESDRMPIRYPDFGKRVQEAMERTSKTVNDIKSRLGITYEMARRYSLGQAMPRAEKLQALAEYLGTDAGFLAYGQSVEGSAVDLSRNDHAQMFMVSKADAVPPMAVGEIPYWSAKGSCGGGFLNYEQMPKGHLVKEITFFKKYDLKPDNAFAIYADGNSMADFIVDGDIVIFDKSKTEPQSGKIYAIDHPDGLRIKMLRRDIDGTWILESNNADKRMYPDERISPEHAELLKIHGRFVYRQGG